MTRQRVSSGLPTASAVPPPQNGTAALGVGAQRGRNEESSDQATSRAKGYPAEAVASSETEARVAALRKALSGVPAGSPGALAYEAAIRRLSGPEASL